MWITCFILSVGCLVMAAILSFIINGSKFVKKHKYNLFNSLFAGIFVSALFMFFPIHSATTETTLLNEVKAFLLSMFNSMQIFTTGCEFAVVTDSMGHCPDWLDNVYQIWSATIFVLAPIFTFSFVVSLFKNISAYFKYLTSYFRDAYIFSELNEKSLVLANDIKNKHKKSVVVFTDVFEGNEEKIYELIEGAKRLGAICFKKDILVVDFKKHSAKKTISFFAIGGNETENLNQSLKLIDNYKQRTNTHIYVFSTKIESELLLTATDKGQIRVRRINEVRSLINRLLYENGKIIFQSAKNSPSGLKNISAVVVGMGRHGTEMVKALAWFGQMDGYRIEIDAFDKDELAEEKFTVLSPDLMSPKYNGVEIEEEAQYKITFHAGLDVDSVFFVREIEKLKGATYVLVALGNDDVNIKTAINLRMYFERIGVHPVIQAIVYNSQQKKALDGIKNYGGKLYDINFIGDLESSYIEDVIIDSELEKAALERHLKGDRNEEEFWTDEYNYRSSVASAIHMRARIECGIPGATKTEADLTNAEKNIIAVLEHRRWNAYMRAEGYIYSGSTDKSSRNDLAKMHPALVAFSPLHEEYKPIDSKIGTK